MESAKPSPSIPIISLTPFTTPSSPPSLRLSTAQSLVSACRTIGFCQLTNHGVPSSQIARAFVLSKEFFALSDSQKARALHPPGWKVHRGYSPPGLEKVSNAIAAGGEDEGKDKVRDGEPRDIKESYEVGAEENDEQPNVWPPAEVLASMPSRGEWKGFMLEFYWMLHGTAEMVLTALAMGLGIPAEKFVSPGVVSGRHNQLRLLHYPVVEAEEVESGLVVRMPGHSDWSVITMLFQDCVGGLQVERRDTPGEWVDVEPLGDAIVLNVGDLLARWTDDYLTSTQHRVSLPPRQDRFTGLTRERYSIPYFVTTKPDAVIESLRLGDGDESPPKYEAIKQRDYAAMRARMQY